MTKPRKVIHLDEVKSFKDNNIPLVYNTDGINPIYLDSSTGEVWQKDNPRGAVVLPEVTVKGSNLRAKEAINKLPKEKGLENPMIDPFLGLIGGAGGALYKGAQGSIALGTDLLFPGTIDENLVGAGINNIAGKTIRGTRNLLLASSPRPLALPVRGTIGLPNLTRKVKTNVLPSSGKTIKLGNQEYNDNRAFIAKFNKWNRRYGYPSFPTSLAKNSQALDDAIKNRLNQHNTFLRGVFINNTNPNLDILKTKLKDEGIEPTDENVLEALATRFIPETVAIGGRSGFHDIPVVRDYFKYLRDRAYGMTDDIRPGKNYSGAIYASNALDQAKGYALRGGHSAKNGIYKVRRPIDFSGTREDWVLNAEFPFSNNINSETYYQYELPYLMRYGVSPKESRFDADEYETYMKNWVKNHSDDNNDSSFFLGPASSLRRQFRLHNEDLSKIGFRTGTPFDYYRNAIISRLIDKRVAPKYSQGEIDMADIFDIQLPEKEGLSYNEAVDEVSKFVNSKRFNDAVYKYYKKKQNEAIKKAKRTAIKPLSNKEIKEKIIREGVTPNRRINDIGTSEPMRTTTINKGNPFQHFIFAGEPYEQGLEVVERVPYTDWKNIENFSTAHRGSWTEGISRKSKRNGGSIHIAPSKRGTFTAAATKHGMGVQEFASRVLRNKEDYSPSLVKKANFARNASKWH